MSRIKIVEMVPKDGTSPACIYVCIYFRIALGPNGWDGKDVGWDHAIQ